MESRTIGAEGGRRGSRDVARLRPQGQRRLNREMEERGCITVPGQVSRTYFEKRLFGGEEDSDVGDKR